MSLRTETTYKADAPGKVAQHTNAQGSGVEVPPEADPPRRKMLRLHSCSSRSLEHPPQEESGEIPQAQAEREVSRRHSTSRAGGGRPEPDRCHSTADPQPAAQTPNGRAVALEESDGKHGEAQVDLWDQGVPYMRQQWVDLHYPAPLGVG